LGAGGNDAFGFAQCSVAQDGGGGGAVADRVEDAPGDAADDHRARPGRLAICSGAGSAPLSSFWGGATI
jgi:hypothetical protein